MKKPKRPAAYVFLRLFFNLLYHSFAWSYDLVATAVSLGRWKQWVHSVVPFLVGPKILELGYGPGHLQAQMAQQGFDAFGIDESMQMSRLARRRLAVLLITPRLVRGRAEKLPYPGDLFDTVVATFPSEYIAAPETLEEIHRVLKPGSRLVVLLAAWITGKSIPDRAAALLFRLTGQVPTTSSIFEKALPKLKEAGFSADLNWLEIPASRLLVITAVKNTK